MPAAARYFSPNSRHHEGGDEAARTIAGGSAAAGSSQQQVWFSVNSWWTPAGASTLMPSTAAGTGSGQRVLGTATAGEKPASHPPACYNAGNGREF